MDLGTFTAADTGINGRVDLLFTANVNNAADDLITAVKPDVTGISVFTIIHTVAPLKNSRIRLHTAVLSSIPRKAVKTTSIIIPPPVPANPVPKPMVRPKSREIEVLSALRRDHHVHVALEDDCGVRLQSLGGRPAGTGAISISGSVSSWSFLRCWLNNVPVGAVVPAFLPRSMRQMARRPNARRQAQPVFHPPRPRGKGWSATIFVESENAPKV